jgi:hypothetical protein
MRRKNSRFVLRLAARQILGLLCCLSLLPGAEKTVVQTVTMAVSEICALSVTGNPGMLTVTRTADGSSILEPTDTSTALGFTSTVGRGGSRSISVRWENDSRAPSGCKLLLRAVEPPGRGQGQSRGWIMLSESPQMLITDIKSCSTGGTSRGVALEFKLAVVSEDSLRADERTTARLLLTLTDEG